MTPGGAGPPGGGGVRVAARGTGHRRLALGGRARWAAQVRLQSSNGREPARGVHLLPSDSDPELGPDLGPGSSCDGPLGPELSILETRAWARVRPGTDSKVLWAGGAGRPGRHGRAVGVFVVEDGTGTGVTMSRPEQRRPRPPIPPFHLRPRVQTYQAQDSTRTWNQKGGVACDGGR